jgi:hypothetical protein
MSEVATESDEAKARAGLSQEEMSVSAKYHSATLCLILDRAARLAPVDSKVDIEHVLGAIIESLPEQCFRAWKPSPAFLLLWEAGIRWDRATRIKLGIIRPEERAEAAERAELARLKAKYEGGARDRD